MFENVLGHEDAKQILKEDIEQDTVSHAYLFFGTNGIGKKKLALEFAKKLLNNDNLDSCIDFKYVEKIEDKKEITVDQIRDKIINNVYIAPATCNRKVYIINDAHLMNLASQNTLLKTLEDAPKSVVIILVSNSDMALINTILSRLKKIHFNNLQDEVISAYIKTTTNKDITEQELKYANGSLNTALKLVENSDINKYTLIQDLFELIKTKNKLQAMKILDKINFKEEETFNYLEYLMLNNNFYDKIDIIEWTKRRIKQNASEDIAKQAFLIKMIRER